jgi:hypothetical protein
LLENQEELDELISSFMEVLNAGELPNATITDTDDDILTNILSKKK